MSGWWLPQNVEPHPRGLYATDPELDFVLAPGLRGRSRSPEWDVEVRTNASGMREREVTPKAPGSVRILAVGDSFTFGA